MSRFQLAAIVGLVSLTLAAASGNSAWHVGLKSVGPITFGISIEEARRLLHDLSEPPMAEVCDYWSPAGIPESTGFLVESGRVMRLDVFGTGTATISGARVGDTETRIKELYGERIEVQPHPYTDGHYLVYVPKDPADSAYRMIFETDGSVVIRYRAGVRPGVEYIEGCS